VYLNLMKSSATPLDDFRTMLRGVPDGIAGVYVVDSYGAMVPADVRRYITAVGDMFATVGFHGHDNLGLATVNSICAWQSGAAIIDGTLDGIGRGSGNAPVESLAGIVNVLDDDLFDYREMAKLAQFVRSNLDVIVDNRMMQVLGGVIGIHSGYFPLVEQLAERYGTEPAELMETAVRLAEQSARPADIQAAADRIAASARRLPDENDPLPQDKPEESVDRDDVATTDAITHAKIAA
jgi:4-hydroxy 2-oxovalerate aldolase